MTNKLVNLMTKRSVKEIEDKLIKLSRINLTTRQLCDLELLLNGAFSPLVGFMDEKTYNAVVSNMHLPSGDIWPMPIVLDTDTPNFFNVGEEVVLCDEYGKPIAFMKISSIYRPEKIKEAMSIYGTTKKDHFGVCYLFDTVRNFYIGGAVEGIAEVERFDFKEHRHSPHQIRKMLKQSGWKNVIAFQTRNPLHKVHFELLSAAAKKYNGMILIHPAVGMTKSDDVDHITRIRSYIKFYQNYMKDKAHLSLLPLAMRMAGPKEAVWHAVIRRNFGATHFIVGRDHAGPGKDMKGVPFYDKYAAQDLVKQYASEIGIEVIAFEEMAYVPQEKRYLEHGQLKKHHTPLMISGSEVRRKLLAGEEIPDWFSFPDIIDEIRRGYLKNRKDGVTIFFTGLPCSGKSTIARLLYFKLLEIQDKKVTLLDGDVIRQNLSKGLGFTKEDRNANIERIGYVASEITKHGGIAICSAIAPYEIGRGENRRRINQVGSYVEVYVSTPLNVCIERDVKGLYKKAQAGKLTGMTGIDDPYEVPQKPEIKLNTRRLTPEQSVQIIIDHLTEHNVVKIIY